MNERATAVIVFDAIMRVLAGLGGIWKLAMLARVLPGPDLPTEAVPLVSTFQRKQIRDWPVIVELLRSNPAVTAISPQISGSAFLVRSEAVSPVSIIGVEPQGIDAISQITPKVIDGDADLGADGLHRHAQPGRRPRNAALSGDDPEVVEMPVAEVEAHRR